MILTINEAEITIRERERERRKKKHESTIKKFQLHWKIHLLIIFELRQRMGRVICLKNSLMGVRKTKEGFFIHIEGVLQIVIDIENR